MAGPDGEEIEIVGCPKAQIGIDVYRAMRAYQFAENGMLPVSGGLLDQTQVYLDFMAQVKAEDARWRKYFTELAAQK